MNYYRLMLGWKSTRAAERFAGGFVGTGFGIIALDSDQKRRCALASVPAISFYRYQVTLKLVKS